jgi:carbonic anhydrase
MKAIFRRKLFWFVISLSPAVLVVHLMSHFMFGRVQRERQSNPGDAVDNAVRAHAVDVVKQLQGTSPIIAERVQSGRVTMVGARHDLHTGKVELLKP